MIADIALAVKDGLRDDADPAFDATLNVDDDYRPVAGSPVVLVADDGGVPTNRGAWTARHTPRLQDLRLTVYAAGRTEARSTVIAAAKWVADHKPGIARVEDIPPPMHARDRKTGAELAWITMPVIARQMV